MGACQLTAGRRGLRATSVRVMERGNPTTISQRGRKGGRSQFPKIGRNEFRKAFTTSDSIRKHVRVLTANSRVAQWRMPAVY